MKRPIVAALLFLIAGIIMGQYPWGIVLFCGGALGVISGCLYARSRYLPVFLCLLFAAAGVVRVQNSLRTDITEPTDTVQIYGTVQDVGQTGSGGVKLIVDAHNTYNTYNAYNTYNTYNAYNTYNTYNTHYARIVVYSRNDGTLASIEPGDYIHMTGKIMPLEKPRNPGDYNEWLTQRARKIDAKLFPATINLLEKRPHFMTMLARFKQKLADVYRQVLPEREAAIMQSMILGDKAGLPEDTRELFKQAGIFHLLCISGLHIAIIMMGLYRLLRHERLDRIFNERSAGIVALVIMVLYCLLTGSAISTVRAVTMCGVAVFARVLFRPYDPVASTTFACIALLLYEPLYLYDVGFQLSFGAVYGIAILTGPVEHALLLLRVPLKKQIKNTLAANIAATTATLPILCYHFYYIPTYALLVNLIILPTAAILVTLGLLIGLTGLLWLPAAAFMAGAVYYLLRFYDFVCRFFTSLPFSTINTGYLGLWTVLAAVGLMLAMAYMLNGFRDVLRERVTAPAIALLVLAVSLFVHGHPTGLTVTVLEAEPGYFAVITYQDRTFVSGGGFNQTDVLADYLQRMNVRRIDGCFLDGSYESEVFSGPNMSGHSVAYEDMRIRDEQDGLYVTYGGAVLFLPESERGEVIILSADKTVISTAAHGAFTIRTDGTRLRVLNYAGV